LEDSIHELLARYMDAPGLVRSAAGHLYHSMPDRLRYGPRFRAFENDARLSAVGDCQQEVEQRLAATLECALSTVPAYAEHRELLSDRRPAIQRLQDLPLTSKLDIKRQLENYVSTGATPASRLRMFTGGSTANPMLFYLERGSTRPKETAYTRRIDHTQLGARASDWTLSLRGRSVRGARGDGRRLWMHEPIKRHLILSSDHMEARYMPIYVAVLRRFCPRRIHAFPSALFPLARWLLDHPCPEFTDQVGGVLLTSETVYPFQLQLFRKVFHCPLVLHYGHSERVLLATSCGSDLRYRFWPLYGYPELVDHRGRTVTKAGVLGEIVGTSFDNRVMPFVRYRTGDLGVWSAFGSRMMDRIEGRLQEFVVTRDHRLISVTTLGAAHFSDLASVDNIQFEQCVAGQLVLKIVTRSRLTQRERSAIERAIADKTQGGCEVSIVEVDEIERTALGKQRMLLQNIRLERYYGFSGWTSSSAKALEVPTPAEAGAPSVAQLRI
jgi:phenylacetate-CoA ligase